MGSVASAAVAVAGVVAVSGATAIGLHSWAVVSDRPSQQSVEVAPAASDPADASPTGTSAIPTLSALQAFTAVSRSAPLGLDTRVTNAGGSAAAVTVSVTVTGPLLPHYLEALASQATLARTTWPLTTGSFFELPPDPSIFMCSGTIAANSTAVITVSSGSPIAGPDSDVAGMPNPSATPIGATVSVTPAGVTAAASATYR